MDERPKEPEPRGPDPVGPDREFCCRYCDGVFPSARDCSIHASKRHAGVGERLVTDEEPDG